MWVATFAANFTSGTCNRGGDLAPETAFYVARFDPTRADLYSLKSFAWPVLPMSQSIASASRYGAVDAVGRRAWAYFTITDWSTHTWVAELSFPGDASVAAEVVRICNVDSLSFLSTSATSFPLTRPARAQSC